MLVLQQKRKLNMMIFVFMVTQCIEAIFTSQTGLIPFRSFFLRISVRDEESDKTLWTGLTKWRKGSSYAPNDLPAAEMLVENLLINL